MKKEKQKKLYLAVGILAAFLLWTAAVRLIDVQPIGPQNSTVGFAALNRFFHDFMGVHMAFYTITDWLSLIPLGFVLGFALLGLIQWFKRRNLLRVDRSILVLGIFYAAVMAAYLFFEVFAVNYRPVLINGYLEASYPSSTTILVLCVMSTALMQLNNRIKNRMIRRYVSLTIIIFITFMVIGRLVSGVHWLTDIIGGILLSAGLVLLYDFFAS